MNRVTKSLCRMTRAGLVSLLLTLPMIAQAATEEKAETSGRAVALKEEAEVTAIDLKTREVTLRGANGWGATLVAPEKVIKLEDVHVGDRLVGTYVAALEGEVRVPTAQELAEPWQVLEGKSVTTDPANPRIESAREIRAVVTIEGLDPETGVVTVKDSRGRQHLIGGVEPAKMKGVTIGQKAVVVFTEAMALSLEKQAKPAQ